MKIELKSGEFETGNELSLLARYCAGFELGTFRNQIEVVRIHLSSVMEARNGKDLICLVEVDLVSGDSFTAEALDSNPYVAIHWALEQAGWVISCQQSRGASGPPIADRREVGRAA